MTIRPAKQCCLCISYVCKNLLPVIGQDNSGVELLTPLANFWLPQVY